MDPGTHPGNHKLGYLQHPQKVNQAMYPNQYDWRLDQMRPSIQKH